MAGYHLAHITEIHGQRMEQTVTAHSFQVAIYAANRLRDTGLSHTAYLAGLLHDMGKCTAKYQDYIQKASVGEDVVRGTVNHTFCGCIYLMERYHIGKPPSLDTLTCEIIAFAIGSHHGVFDCVTPENTGGFEHRIQKDRDEIGYEEARAGFLTECTDENKIDSLFSLARDEITVLSADMKKEFGNSRTTISFLVGMAARMVLSAVIDGDRRDTAEFMNGRTTEFPAASKELWTAQLQPFEEELLKFDAATPINQARRIFSDQCREFAVQHGKGIYRMTLPTGAGKTLAALRYALVHAATYNKKRILFIIPLLSVLEQNSSVIHKYIKDESLITEHHSNIVKTFETEDELDRYELLTETWESPVIITTLVQLLNTLFSGQTSCIRRMSALSDSVIVIDEIQSLPKNMTNMFNMALNFLAYECSATIILSSATQPCFDKTAAALKYSTPSDIVPYKKENFSVFKRTEVEDHTSPYGMTMEELADFALETAASRSSLLVICNTKDSARTLYSELKRQQEDFVLFHLSASMCMAHRQNVLAQINGCLKSKQKMICISTQIVEAGVDFSFESVIRIAAGMDNIAQAAGRCNRNNDFNTICPVSIVNLKQGIESLKMLPEIATAQRCTQKLLYNFSASPCTFENDLLSAQGISAFYTLLFNETDIKGRFGFPAKLPGGDIENLFDLLADNGRHTARPNFTGRYFLNQSFKTAGQLFKVFDENTTDILVPYNDEAEEIIADLFSEKAAHDYFFIKERLERAKRYSIQIFEYQKKKLTEYGMLHPGSENHFIALDKQCYETEIGLVIDNFIF